MLFNPGQLLATPAALDHLALHQSSAISLFRRHICGDWGDIHIDDRELNDQAVRNDSRIFSAYQIGNGRIYIITEWDRSATTMLLASEY